MTGKKGPGYCAICNQLGGLTRDHVPPKGCVDMTNAVLSRLTMDAEAGELSSNNIHIQGGLKFKTICGRCNNDLLGAQFDPELKLFVDSMRTGMQNVGLNVVLPRLVHAEVNLHLVTKAVIGHILAAHSVAQTVTKHDDLGASEVLRQYFLRRDMPFPEDWRLYCWPYFSRRQIILRHGSWMDVSLQNPAQKSVYGHVLKFLPLGFWLVYKQPVEFHISAQEFTPYGLPVNERERVTFDLRHAPHRGYPEIPTGHHVLLFANEQSSVTTPHKK